MKKRKQISQVLNLLIWHITSQQKDVIPSRFYVCWEDYATYSLLYLYREFGQICITEYLPEGSCRYLEYIEILICYNKLRKLYKSSLIFCFH